MKAKKLLCLVLAFAMVLGTVGFSALAEEVADELEIAEETAIEVTEETVAEAIEETETESTEETVAEVIEETETEVTEEAEIEIVEETIPEVTYEEMENVAGFLSEESESEGVAKVGNTPYATIDEAIAHWTNGTTLTLLDNVTLSDVITIKSTEHHILNLGTFTMTAASGKNAFEIIASGTGDAERSAITINADADNPGALDAGNKSCIYYNFANGKISGDDRPIIKINGGVFYGTTSSFGSAGIYIKGGSAARQAATVNISGGTFNCSINGQSKSKLLISGGTFNYSVGSQGDSTAYRLISGGRFKSFGFMTADSNNTKFWIGTSMANSDVGLYVDDEGYLVVGGPVITEAGDQFAASIDYSKWNSYLQYSSAKTNKLYCTDINYALVKDKNAVIYSSALTEEEKEQPLTATGNLTVDMSAEDSDYTGDVTLGNKDATFTVIFDYENPYEGKVTAYTGYAILVTETMGTIVTRVYSNTDAYAKIGETYYATLQEAVNNAKENDTIEILKEINEGTIKLPAVIKNLTIEGNGTAVIKDTTIQSCDGNSLNYDGLTFNGIIFDNSNVVMTGWRADEVYKNIAFTNNQFKNIERASNYAAIHLNSSTQHPIEGLTITGNIIDGVSGSSNSGIYTTAIDGEIVVENNTIKNVAFRPFVLQVTNNNGTADTVTVKGNTFSDSPVGRLQILGTDAEGEDAVHVAINRNVVHAVTGSYELCCWNFNDETTTSDLSGNYWGEGVIDNASGFYWNEEQASNEDLVDLGIFPIYTRLTSEGKIDETSIVTGIDYAVAKVGERLYSSLKTAVENAEDGATITIIKDIALAAQDANSAFKPAYNRESYAGLIIPDDKVLTIDLNGKTISYVDEYGDCDNVAILNLGNLTITDGVGNGKITYKPVAGATTYSYFYSTIFNCGTLTVNGGTIENTAEVETDVSNAVDNHSRLSHEYGNDCILTVNGGKLTGAYYYAIRQYTHYFEGVKNRVTINNGTIEGGIYMQHGDSWYYADASKNRLNVDGYLTINGGNFIATATDNFNTIKSRLANPDNNAWGLEINGGAFNDASIQLLVQRGVYYTNGVSGATTPAEASGARNTEWLEKNGGFISGGTFNSIGDINDVTTNLQSFLAEGYDLQRTGADLYTVLPEDEEITADTISIEYKDVTVEGTEGEKTFEIVVKANEGDVINELASVDLSFVYTSNPFNGGDITFDVLPADGFTMTKHEDAKKYPERYMFNYNGVGKNFEGTANAIPVGTITVTGYGSFTIATADVDTNIVNATTLYDNLVDSYTAAGAEDDDATTGALDISDKIDDEDGDVAIIAVPVRTLKVNVTFPNAIKDNNAVNYQDMKVEITGNIDGVSQTITYNLGEGGVAMNADGAYVFEEGRLVLNESYTVTVSGAGYRTARYTVRMTDNKELKFWNNVMDEAQVIELENNSSEAKVTFLAGDIVKDNKINIYDLSAVVSYFGTENLVEDYPQYAKYDLNRDGKIDSKDVAYILVSWDN